MMRLTGTPLCRLCFSLCMLLVSLCSGANGSNSGKEGVQELPKLSLHPRNDMVEGKHGVFVIPRNDRYIGRSLRIYGEWSEGEYTDIYSQLIKPGDLVLDVGANIGAFTVSIAKLVGPDGVVHAFEPMNAHLRILASNLVLNGLENVELHHAFVSARQDGPFRFSKEYDMGEASKHEYFNYGSFSMLKSMHTSGSLVPVIAIDDLHLPRCDFIKADVEGAELGVILGATETIRKFKPLLYLEIDEDQARWEKVVLTLYEMGYACIRHIVPLFNPDNHKGVDKNIFAHFINNIETSIGSHMMICAPKGTNLEIGTDPIGSFQNINVRKVETST